MIEDALFFLKAEVVEDEVSLMTIHAPIMERKEVTQRLYRILFKLYYDKYCTVSL